MNGIGGQRLCQATRGQSRGKTELESEEEKVPLWQIGRGFSGKRCVGLVCSRSQTNESLGACWTSG